MGILVSLVHTALASLSDRPSQPPTPVDDTPDRPLSPLSLGPLAPVPTRPPTRSLLSTPSPLHLPDPFQSAPSPTSDPTLSLFPPPPSSLFDDPPPQSQSPPLPSSPAPSAPHSLPEPALPDPLAFDASAQHTLDLSFDDDGLSTLEKIYLFSRSQATFHKVYILHVLPDVLNQVTPVEAVEYVLPLLSGLAMDEDDGVREALVAQLVSIVWWFATNCRLTDDEAADPSADPTPLLVHAFTPVIGTLLLSTVALANQTRLAVVGLLRRIRDDDAHCPLFEQHQRKLLQQEILRQVVVGIGRLDLPDEDDAMDVDSSDATLTPQPSTLHRSSPLAPPRSLPPPTPPPRTLALASTPDPSSLPVPSDASSRDPSPLSELAAPSPALSLSHTWSPTDSFASQPFVESDDVCGGSERLGWEDSPMFSHQPLGSPVAAQAPPPDDGAMHIDSTPSERPPYAIRSDGSPPLSEPKLAVENALGDSAVSEEVDAAEQAAFGRFSSMSLIAAVSAGGLLLDDMKSMFVKEVERVGRDPAPYVRKEASYAVGALAKVVPEEIVIMSLLPLFGALSADAAWQVRYSALFALPPILSRLGPHQRRELALSTVQPLSQDSSATVRMRLLETLGEVMYTFRDDPGGVPEDILRLFLGDQAQSVPSSPWRKHLDIADLKGRPPRAVSDPPLPTPSPTPPFDEGPRQLICAFNLPAVALTLGPARWSELRLLYTTLSTSMAFKVRRTLAASAGELAKIIGVEAAQEDVLPVWTRALGAEEAEVRMKAVEAVGTLIEALGPGPLEGAGGKSVLGTLEDCWRERSLGWRERESVAQGLQRVVEAGAIEKDGRAAAESMCRLVMLALEDEMAAVRVAGVELFPPVFGALRGWEEIQEHLCANVRALAHSSTFRWRMVFVSCYQTLVFSDHGGPGWMHDPKYWSSLAELSTDPIIDVRIGVARFIGQLYDRFFRDGPPAPPAVEEIVRCLRNDASQGVRAYVSLACGRARAPERELDTSSVPTAYSFATFSRPPPPVPSHPVASDETGR